MRVLFDTNVVLDVLLNRARRAAESARLFDAVANGAIEGLVAARSVTTVDCIVAKAYSRERARRDVADLLRLFEVAGVGRAELEAALTSGFKDYEDGVLHEAARAAGAEAIVTRNGADFVAAALRVYAPADLLAALRP